MVVGQATGEKSRSGDNKPHYLFHRNGSPTTGTLTVSTSQDDYTADINLNSIRSRNAFVDEAVEMLGLNRGELKKALVAHATSLTKESAANKQRGAAEPRALKTEPLSKEAKTAGEELAHQRDILVEFRADLAQGGFAGETENAEILFLAMCSRFLEKMVSVVPKGPSAGGKSFLVETVLSYFPKSAYLTVSSLSEHALAYIDEPLAHRILVVAEAAGAEGQKAAYFLRTLLSEGRVEHQTNVRDPKTGRITPMRIKLEGPTALITTTTAIKLHPENETRVVSLNVSDTEDQTKAIIESICKKESGEEKEAQPDRSRWHALQEHIEGAEHRVVIPFACALGRLIPPKAVRLRRDIRTILSLIKAHAVLHQATRERDEEGRIVATLDDYEAVRRLIGDSIDEGVESAVRKTVRETVEAASRLVLADQKTETTSVKAIAEELGLDRSSTRRRIYQTLEAGYLRKLEDKRGMPMQLALGDSMPQDASILPLCQQILEVTSSESSETPNPRARVHGVSQSSLCKPNNPRAREEEKLAHVHRPEDAKDPNARIRANDQKGPARAPTPIDKGDTGGSCTRANRNEAVSISEKEDAECDTHLLDAQTVEGVLARAERDGRLLTDTPESRPAPDHDSPIEKHVANPKIAFEHQLKREPLSEIDQRQGEGSGSEVPQLREERQEESVGVFREQIPLEQRPTQKVSSGADNPASAKGSTPERDFELEPQPERGTSAEGDNVVSLDKAADELGTEEKLSEEEKQRVNDWIPDALLWYREKEKLCVEQEKMAQANIGWMSVRVADESLGNSRKAKAVQLLLEKHIEQRRVEQGRGK